MLSCSIHTAVGCSASGSVPLQLPLDQLVALLHCVAGIRFYHLASAALLLSE
jgi:hypothetical protein